MDLQVAAKQGAKIERPEQTVQIPELAQIMRQFYEMKQGMSAKYEEKWKAKLAKMDELIEAIKGIKVESGDNKELMAMLKNIQKEHTKIASEHAALMAVEKEEHEGGDGPCEYKVTGRRDQRGLIDLEHGLTFTPVK